MSENPYRGLPDHQFWRRAVAGVEPFRFDPVVETRFTVGRADRVATAGSCFAQHIARRLAGAGFDYLVTEDGAGLPEAERAERQFGLFSARFGNIYTTAQLRQLLEACFAGRTVAEDVWERPDGRYVDALRPQVEPAGFASVEEVRAARTEHLDAVRRMFLECDVFVFTLGLTECWRSRIDGTVYPLAPGVAGGSHDEERHEFVNLGVTEVVADLEAFLAGLREVNPGVRVVLTVSPVPLVATYENRNVLVSTTYSKSVLRVAADMSWREHAWVEYFPSYEIITGSFHDSRYYDPDYRGVNSIGVDHAMRCFLGHYTDTGDGGPAAPPTTVVAMPGGAGDVVCDEEALDQAGVRD